MTINPVVITGAWNTPTEAEDRARHELAAFTRGIEHAGGTVTEMPNGWRLEAPEVGPACRYSLTVLVEFPNLRWTSDKEGQ